VDAYLEIATAVLRAQKRPLTPRAILAAAYRSGIVSQHLHGKTQHKTLGARLSEDLVQRHERSLFFRPEPGRFFLREFLTDTSIPEEFRRPVPTRRRFRELVLGPALAVDERTLDRSVSPNKPIDPSIILGLLRDEQFRYADPRQHPSHTVFFRSFVCVQRGSQILSYRLGRYRETRDAFMNKRCIGFSTFVHDFEYTLFNQHDFGIVNSGVHAVEIDLDIPDVATNAEKSGLRAKLSHFIWAARFGRSDLLAVIRFQCPDWFEPTKRRLALNNVCWLDGLDGINNVKDFDPWSQQVMASVGRGKALETSEAAALTG
jgi:hypothetical protein